MKKKKRILSMLLAVFLVATLLPVPTAAAGTGTLAIASSPAGADVYINSELQTTVTPCELTLPSGTYSLKLSIPGYEDYSAEVTISEGQTTTVSGIVQLPALVETAAANIITVNSSGDSNPDSSLTVEQVKVQGTITLRDAVTAVLNDESETHYRIEFAEGVSVVTLDACVNINRRGNLTINGDRNRDGTSDVNIAHSAYFLNWLGAINVIASDTYIIGLKFDGSANIEKASFLSIRVPDETSEIYNINNFHVLGCEFANNFEVGVATCGAYGHAATAYSAAGTTNFSNLVFSGNRFNKTSLFSFAGAGDEDYNVIDGYKIVANEFVNCGIGMLAGDAHTWYVYGQDSSQGNGGVAGQIGYSQNNILRNVLISGNNIELNSEAGEEYTAIINVSCANLGNSGNLVEAVTIRNNTSRVLDPGGRNLFASLSLSNVSIGDGGNLPNYAMPDFTHHTSNNIIRNVTMQYNDFELGGGREFLVHNVTTDVGNQEGSGNLFQNIRIQNNRFDSPSGVAIANYMDKSQCGTCVNNNIEGLYFNNNIVTTDASREERTGIVVAGAYLTNLYGSAVTDMPDYSGSMENVYIDGNEVTGDYQYGIVAAGSAGDYANGFGIERLSVCGNTVTLTNSDARFGILASGAAMGTYGNPEDNAPYQPGSINCFLKDVTVSGNNITAKGGIAATGGLYEGAPRAFSVAGNYIDTITIQDNTIAKQVPGEATRDLPGILTAGIVDMWDRLSLTSPAVDGNKVIGMTLGTNIISDFEENKETLDLSAVSSIYALNSIVSADSILSGLKALTDAAYGVDSYEWTWSGTAFDSSTVGSYLAKASRQAGYGMDVMYYEVAVDPSAYETVDGIATVNTIAGLDAALHSDSITKIIVEGFNPALEGEWFFAKDVTINTGSALTIKEGSRLVVAGSTLTLNGTGTFERDSTLVNAGAVINNGTLANSGIIVTLASSEQNGSVANYGTINNIEDADSGTGQMWFIDKLAGDESCADNVMAAWTDVPLDPQSPTSAVYHTADVSTAAALTYAMDSQAYSKIWLSELGDTHDEQGELISGVDISVDGDFTVFKPLYVFKNDSLTVSGNLQVAASGESGLAPELSIEGTVSIGGNFVNNSDLFIDGTLSVTGTAINNGFYTQTAEAVVNGTIIDSDTGDHMKGYYVTDQAGWEAALADTRCNPIVVGPEANILILTDTTVRSNLFVEGTLTVAENVTMTLNMRYDGDANGVINNISGTLTNNGILNLNMPLDVCGSVINNGEINMTGYDGNEYDQNWTTDGHIFLYTELNGEGPDDDKNGSLTNHGHIYNENTISINHDAKMVNTATGMIDNYGRIESWDGINEGNIHPLHNLGLIWGGDMDLNYEGLFFTWTEWRDLEGAGSYPVPAKDDQGNLNCNATSFPAVGDETCVFYYRYYNVETGQWTNRPINAAELSAYDFSENPNPTADITLEEWADLDPDAISSITDPDFTGYEFTKLNYSKFNYYMICYNAGTAENPVFYRLPVSVQLPMAGFYSGPSTNMADMQNNYIQEFSFTPTSNTFYAIVDVPPGFTLDHYTINDSQVTVTRPDEAANVFMIQVNGGTNDEINLNFTAYLQDIENPETMWSMDNWIRIYPGEYEGLVFCWTDWKEDSNGGYQYAYPVPGKDEQGNINYDTSAYPAKGGATWVVFFRHQIGDVWVYDLISPSALTPSDQSIEIGSWAPPEEVTITDPDYVNYQFTQLEFAQFGNYEISYTVGEGESAVTYNLPVTVTLPGVGFYKDTAATEANYIGEFFYTSNNRTFYMIANPDFNIEEGWTSGFEIFDGSDKVQITSTDNIKVYKVIINENVSDEFRLHGKIAIRDSENHEIWSSERDINIAEGEEEGLVFSWTGWRDGSNGDYNFRYPVLDNIYYNTRADVTKGEVTWAVFHKYWDGVTWQYDPVDVSKLNVSDESSITKEEWADPDAGTVPTGDPDHAAYEFTDFNFTRLGSYTISYTVGEGESAVTYNLPVTVALPNLGAYSSAAGDEENWIREVDFSQYRTVYLVPTENLTEADLSKSEFEIWINGISTNLVYDQEQGTFTADQIKITAHPGTNGIDYFTAEISAAPFASDFHLNFWIRKGDRDEILSNNIYFYSPVDDTVAVNLGGMLNTPALSNDTSVTAPQVGGSSVQYYEFTAGSLSGQAYLFELSGAGESRSDRVKLYLFDSNWVYADESAWENLNDRNATIDITGLTNGSPYYIAIFNGSTSTCDFILTASVENIPEAPGISWVMSEQGTSGVEMFGASEGQEYVIYAKIDGQWQDRGTQIYDPNDNPDPKRFWHAFDFVNDGETVTAVAGAIRSNGVESIKSEELAVSVTRNDTLGGPYEVVLMDYPENDTAMLKVSGEGNFNDGAYYRLHHEDATGRWDYNGSFFGDGSKIAAGSGRIEGESISETGKWIFTEYTQTGSGSTWTIGWKYLVDTESGLGSIIQGVFDNFSCSLNTGTKQVETALNVRTLTSTPGSEVDLYYAMYRGGRMVGIQHKKVQLTVTGIFDTSIINYAEGHQPDTCKAFVLNGECVPLIENFEEIFAN